MRTRTLLLGLNLFLSLSANTYAAGVEALVNKSNELIMLQQYEAGLAMAEQAIEADPENAMAWNNKGAALRNMGRYDEAVEAAEKAAELQPNLYLAWWGKAESLHELGRDDEALDAVNKVIEIKPDVGWETKGKILDKLGRAGEAYGSFSKAIELNPTLGDAWLSRASFYSGHGNKNRALQDLKKALDLDPGLKGKARNDQGLNKSLKNDPEFKKLVN